MGEPAELWDFGTIRRDLPGGGRGTVSRAIAPSLPPMPSVSSRAPNPQPQAQSQQRQHQQYASQPAQSSSSSQANRYGSVRSRNSGSLRAKASSAYASTASGFSDNSTLKSGGTIGRSHQAAYDTVRYTPEQTRQLHEEDDEEEEAGLAYDLSDDERPTQSNGVREPQQGSIDEPARHTEDEEDEGDDEIDDSKAILDDVVVPVIDSVRLSPFRLDVARG